MGTSTVNLLRLLPLTSFQFSIVVVVSPQSSMRVSSGVRISVTGR